jgi:hypothetical protein
MLSMNVLIVEERVVGIRKENVDRVGGRSSLSLVPKTLPLVALCDFISYVTIARCSDYGSTHPALNS